MRSARIFNLPNLITFFRILLIPFVWFFLELDVELPSIEFDFTLRYSPGKIAALLILLAGVSDFFDGYFARRWKIESLLGKFLDPLADKLLLLVGLVMLMQLDRVESWLVIILLSREIIITGLRGVAIGEGLVIPAGKFGKFKLVFQLIGLGLIMWYGTFFGVSAYTLGLWILYVALLISLVSGYLYLHDFFTALSKKKSTQD
jgi:CDP-diacylglycerol--glycerol-3-phosphate 3-phosphatidyltransferase